MLTLCWDLVSLVITSPVCNSIVWTLHIASVFNMLCDPQYYAFCVQFFWRFANWLMLINNKEKKWNEGQFRIWTLACCKSIYVPACGVGTILIIKNTLNEPQISEGSLKEHSWLSKLEWGEVKAFISSVGLKLSVIFLASSFSQHFYLLLQINCKELWGYVHLEHFSH